MLTGLRKEKRHHIDPLFPSRDQITLSAVLKKPPGHSAEPVEQSKKEAHPKKQRDLKSVAVASRLANIAPNVLHATFQRLRLRRTKLNRSLIRRRRKVV